MNTLETSGTDRTHLKKVSSIATGGTKSMTDVEKAFILYSTYSLNQCQPI